MEEDDFKNSEIEIVPIPGVYAKIDCELDQYIREKINITEDLKNLMSLFYEGDSSKVQEYENLFRGINDDVLDCNVVIDEHFDFEKFTEFLLEYLSNDQHSDQFKNGISLVSAFCYSCFDSIIMPLIKKGLIHHLLDLLKCGGFPNYMVIQVLKNISIQSKKYSITIMRNLPTDYLFNLLNHEDDTGKIVQESTAALLYYLIRTNFDTDEFCYYGEWYLTCMLENINYLSEDSFDYFIKGIRQLDKVYGSKWIPILVSKEVNCHLWDPIMNYSQSTSKLLKIISIFVQEAPENIEMKDDIIYEILHSDDPKIVISSLGLLKSVVKSKPGFDFIMSDEYLTTLFDLYFEGVFAIKKKVLHLLENMVSKSNGQQCMKLGEFGIFSAFADCLEMFEETREKQHVLNALDTMCLHGEIPGGENYWTEQMTEHNLFDILYSICTEEGSSERLSAAIDEFLTNYFPDLINNESE